MIRLTTLGSSCDHSARGIELPALQFAIAQDSFADGAAMANALFLRDRGIEMKLV